MDFCFGFVKFHVWLIIAISSQKGGGSGEMSEKVKDFDRFVFNRCVLYWICI